MAKRLMCVLLSVLMIVAMLPTGVFADVESVTFEYSESELSLSSGGWGCSISGNVITFTGSWGEVYLNTGNSLGVDLSNYDTVTCDLTASDTVQLKAYDTEGNDHYSGYNTFTLSTGGEFTIASILVQDCTSDGCTVTVNSLTLSDSNGVYSDITCTYSESDLTVTSNWGVTISGNTVTFNSQWAQAYVNLPSTVDYSSYNTVSFTASGVSGTTNFVVHYTDTDDTSYFGFSADGTYTKTLAGTVDYMELQYTESGTTGTATLDSVTLSYVSYTDWTIEGKLLGSGGWSSSYDNTTSTITFNSSYTGCGWWYGESDTGVYLSSVTVETGSEMAYTLVVSYTDETTSSEYSDDSGACTVTVDSTKEITQIYIQGHEAGDLTVTNVTYELPSEDVLPSFYSRTLSLGGMIGVNFYVDFTDVEDPDSYYVEFTVDDTTTTVAYSDATLGSNGYYKFTCDVPCWEMGAEITAVLTDGSTTAATMTYSVETYAERMIGNYTDELDALLNAMLTYGHYAYKYKEDGTDVSNYDDETGNVNDLSDYEAELVDGDKITGATASLILDETCELSFTLSDDSYVMYIDDVETTSITDILVQNWDYEYDVLITDSDGETICEYTYSVLSYANYVLENSDDDALVNLVKAMYLYNVAADAYLG